MAKDTIFPAVPIQPAPIPAGMEDDPVEQARFYKAQSEWLEYQLSRTKVGWTGKQGNRITRVLTEYATPDGGRFFTLADSVGTEGGMSEDIARQEMFPEWLTCPNCLGQGVWEAECCNGASGCSCKGQTVQMGTCQVCHGSGQVKDGEYDGMANLRMIEGLSYLGSGPR